MAPDSPWSTSLLPTQAPLGIVPAQHASLGLWSLGRLPAQQQLQLPTLGTQLHVSRDKSVSGPAEALGVASADGTGQAWCHCVPQ